MLLICFKKPKSEKKLLNETLSPWVLLLFFQLEKILRLIFSYFLFSYIFGLLVSCFSELYFCLCELMLILLAFSKFKFTVVT